MKYHKTQPNVYEYEVNHVDSMNNEHNIYFINTASAIDLGALINIIYIYTENNPETERSISIYLH